MSTETLVPNADDSGWPTGAFSDIDEDFATPDGAVMRTTDAELDDILILDFGDSSVVDADTVTNITVDLRALCSGTGGKDDYQVEVLIGGSPIGTAVLHTSVGQSFVTLSSNDTGWNADRTAAEMDGLQVRITSQQRAMAAAGNWDIDTVRVVVTFDPPPDIQQEHYRFATPITGAAHEAYTLVGSEDTSFEIVLDDDYCIIVKLGNDGGAGTLSSYQLEYNVDGAGWNDVNATSSNVRAVDSGDTDNATSTTERLTTSARTFDTSRLDDSNGSIAIYILPADEETELYFAITFRSADLSGGESIDFRLSATDTITFDITPNATVPGGAGIDPGVAGFMNLARGNQ